MECGSHVAPILAENSGVEKNKKLCIILAKK